MSVKTTSSKEKKSVLTIGLHHQFFNVILLFCKVTPMGSEKKTPQRSLLVDLLIVLFGVSSWVAVNGLWVELPVLVKILPESWELASYIVVTSQVANLGPILFSAARKIWSQKVLEIPFIHGSLALVIISSILLSIFWDTTTYIGNELHSTALLALTFFMSLVDCTSSLLYLPFIANFKEQYVISYLVGAGLSGPIPGLLALAQGVGGYAQCRNVTVTNVTESGNFTEYHIEPYYAPPRFSTNIFFALLSAQMVVSWIAFVLLNKLPSVKKEKVSFIPVIIQPKHPAVDEKFQSSTDASVSFEKTASSEQNLLGRPFITHSQYIFLLGIQGFVSALHNGVLLSVQTYSCLPYGSIAYHLTVTLSSIANPLSCFLAMFLPVYSVGAVAALTVCGSCWAAYILATALLSPHPPFVGTILGACLVVIAWVLVCGLVAFIKACIAAILRRQGGQTALYRCGVVTQIGSAIGAVTIFLLLRYTDLFQSYSPCS